MSAVAPAPLQGATTRAVLRYFEDEPARADSFDHLVAICSLAVRPYYLRDPHDSLPEDEAEFIVTGIPQFKDLDGSRTGHNVREEGTANAATRAWIQTWLLGFLARYRDLSPEELLAAADKDEFRYLGRLCRLRLLDARRAQKAAKRYQPPISFLDGPVSKGGAPLLDYVETNRQDGPSSLSTHASYEGSLACVSAVFRAVMANRAALRRLDLLDGLRAVLANGDHLDLSMRNFNARVIQSIASMRRISLPAARAYKRKFIETLARELAGGDPAVRAIFLELQTESPSYRRFTESGSVVEDVSIPPGFFEANGCGWDKPDGIARKNKSRKKAKNISA
jgi:hypothetical protein